MYKDFSCGYDRQKPIFRLPSEGLKPRASALVPRLWSRDKQSEHNLEGMWASTTLLLQMTLLSLLWFALTNSIMESADIVLICVCSACMI